MEPVAAGGGGEGAIRVPPLPPPRGANATATIGWLTQITSSFAPIEKLSVALSMKNQVETECLAKTTTGPKTSDLEANNNCSECFVERRRLLRTHTSRGAYQSKFNPFPTARIYICSASRPAWPSAVRPGPAPHCTSINLGGLELKQVPR